MSVITSPILEPIEEEQTPTPIAVTTTFTNRYQELARSLSLFPTIDIDKAVTLALQVAGSHLCHAYLLLNVGWLSHLHLLTLGNYTFIMMFMTCIKNQKEELKAKQRCYSLAPLNLHFVESTIPRYIALDAITKDLQSSLTTKVNYINTIFVAFQDDNKDDEADKTNAKGIDEDEDDKDDKANEINAKGIDEDDNAEWIDKDDDEGEIIAKIIDDSVKEESKIIDDSVKTSSNVQDEVNAKVVDDSMK
ncbi:hypothetical protein QL285_076797 [Trifolium repens]|nr:hypothetical protein QL285_076797 [Trifolium repens]